MNNGSQITYFAETDARNKRVKFGIKDEDRLRHIYSIGKTGMGKSTFLENMAIQDIQNGNGMAFLDPHGKTADLLLEYIPEHRIQDVIYFAPFDTSYPISFNVMEDVGPDRRHLVVSGLMSAFEKIWVDAWSARMAYILQNTLAALLEFPGATMLGINRMYSDKNYRQKVVDNIKDPTVKSFWVDEYAKYTDRFAAEATPAIQNKVGQFTSNPLIRNIIGQPKSTFDIRKIMDEKKILIVNLSKGLVGENNANLLGSMLVTKIYLAAMSRADASPAELAKMPNFYLYVDEFQSFANKSFADILSEARKYKLSLNITHQYIEQMPEEVAAAVFGNVGTMISFRVGSHDAEVLAKEFAPVFTMEDLVNLSKYQIYLKLMIDNVASQPFSALTLGPIPPLERSFKTEVIESSRTNYAGKKEEVEKQIHEWHAQEQTAVQKEKKEEAKKVESEPKKTEEPKKENTESRSKTEHKFERREPERKPQTPEPQKKPEVPQEKRENVLAKALADALKEKNVVKNTETIVAEQKFDGQRIKVEQKKETISLQDLRHGDKNKNKGPSEQNMNALKEALLKAQSVKPASVPKPNPAPQSAPKAPPQPEVAKPEPDKKLENKDHSGGSKDHPGGPKDHSAKGSDGPKEVPEDVLRKILAGK